MPLTMQDHRSLADLFPDRELEHAAGRIEFDGLNELQRGWILSDHSLRLF